jgi:hypothetical protein
MMGTEGLEPVAIFSIQGNDLGKPSSPSAAKSGAVFADYHIDTDLETIIRAWPDLSRDVRSDILELVQLALAR